MSVFLCGNCKSDYNEINRRPLSIPCGHVFCEECIRSFIIGTQGGELDAIKCPSDSKVQRVSLKKIPCCHQILNNLPYKRCLNCIRHRDKEVKYFCKLHSIFPCVQCVSDHVQCGSECVPLDSEKLYKDFHKLEMKINKEHEALSSVKDKLELEEKKINEFYKRQLHNITKTFERFITVLKNKRKYFLDCVKNSHELHLKKLTAKKNKLMSSIEHILDYKQNHQANLNFEDVFNLKIKLINHLKKINTAKEETHPPFAHFFYQLQYDEFNFGEIEYVSNIDEVDTRNISCIKSKTLTGNSTFLDETKMENVFQDNLLNDKNTQGTELFNTSPIKKQIPDTERLVKKKENPTSNKLHNTCSFMDDSLLKCVKFEIDSEEPNGKKENAMSENKDEDVQKGNFKSNQVKSSGVTSGKVRNKNVNLNLNVNVNLNSNNVVISSCQKDKENQAKLKREQAVSKPNKGNPNHSKNDFNLRLSTNQEKMNPYSSSRAKLKINSNKK